MKKTCFGFLTFASIAAHAAVSVSLSPSAQIASTGAPISVDLVVSGLGNGTSLGTFDINLGYDASVLAFTGADFGNQLDLFGLGDVRSVTPDPGNVNVFEVSLESIADLNNLQQPSFRLATITFNSLISAINSPLTISINAIGDASGSSIPVSTTGATFTITSSVPEPSVYGMLVLGITGFGMIRRRAQVWRI